MREMKQFEMVSAKGNVLQMTQLLRFRCQGPEMTTDYVVAMETKWDPFLNNAWVLDVFRVEPKTNQLLWVSLQEEEVYRIARRCYAQWQEAGHFLNAYKRRIVRNCGSTQIQEAYMEELEIKLYSNPDARECALRLMSEFEEKLKTLRALHAAMCNLDRKEDMKQAADRLVHTLWGTLDGLDIATDLLREVTGKMSLLDALQTLILEDASDVTDVQLRVRAFILETFWERPVSIKSVRRMLHEHFHKVLVINELQELYGKRGEFSVVTQEDIHSLWFDQNWESRWHALYHALYMAVEH